MSLLDTALVIHQFGANVTAIETMSKGPAHTWDQWQSQRQRIADVQSLPWSGYTCRKETKRHKPGDKVTIGAIGIISGIGGWRVFDIDAPKDKETKRPICIISDATVDQLLAALGLPATYTWVWRSGSGAGWEIAIRCDDPMPRGVLTEDKREKGVFTGWPAGDGAEWHHLELRWETCQTVVVCDDDRAYAWRYEAPTAPPLLVPIHRVIAAFFDMAPPEPWNLGTIERAVIDQIKQRFDLVAYAQTELGGETEREGREIRITGHQGLLIDPDKGIWYIHGDAIGGDALDLVAYCTYRTTARNLNGKSAEILEKAARYAGVPMPDRKPVSPPVPPAQTKQQTEYTPTKIDWRSQGTTLRDLQYKIFDPERWIIEGIFPEGACLIAAKYKSKKSWLALALSLPVSMGGKALGRLSVHPGRVLYLDLEGRQQRIQKRTRAILGVQQVEWPDNFHVFTKWPRGDEGMRELDYWFASYPDTVLVVIDVLASFRRPMDKTELMYQYDRDTVDPINELAEKHRAGIALIHHFNKGKHDDIMDSITGSTGLPSAVNTMWALKRDVNDSSITVLEMRGRDLENDDPLALRWDTYLNMHVIEGPANEIAISTERRAIMQLLSDDEPRTPKEIAIELQRPVETVKQLLRKLLNDGLIDKPSYGKYAKVAQRDHSDHSDHSGTSDHSDHSTVDSSIKSDRSSSRVIPPDHSLNPLPEPLNIKSDRSDRYHGVDEKSSGSDIVSNGVPADYIPSQAAKEMAERIRKRKQAQEEQSNDAINP